MIKTNANYGKLGAGYLFPEIGRRVKQYIKDHPGVNVMRLGIGDTTEPLAPVVIEGLKKGVEKLATIGTYTGYGDSEGLPELRKRIAEVKYINAVDESEVFVSDGAKPDSGNIREIFSPDAVVAVQDPAYPVYVDSNVIYGGTGGSIENGRYAGIRYLPCSPENDFFPSEFPSDADLIYICSPNNPTGAIAPRDRLAALVDQCNADGKIIIFDSAYERFIRDDDAVRSIYEIPGARSCAIEIGSFSKDAGFTGVRLGWSVIPKDLHYEGAKSPFEIWTRRQNTKFNGASNVVQYGGLAALSDEGLRQTQETIDYYMRNADIIREGLEACGFKCYGGRNAPYIWLETPGRMDSWAFFDQLLNEAHVVCTPGAGFGASGQGYARLSAFGHRENIIKAVESVKARYGKK